MSDIDVRFGLMRHGIAEAGRPGERDAERRLTREGRVQLNEQVAWLRTRGMGFDVVLSSPLVRARQTAEIIANGLGLRLDIERDLAPGCTPDDYLAIGTAGLHGNRPLMVGHQPDLSTAVAVLSGRHVNFGQGDIALLERTASRRVMLLLHAPASEQRASS